MDLSAHLNNDGVSTVANRTNGDFDGTGMAYPAEQLPAPGPFVHGGVTFAFPSTADGAKNNVSAAKQKISVPPGRYASLRVLGASSSGNNLANGTATYANGTASVSFRLSS